VQNTTPTPKAEIKRRMANYYNVAPVLAKGAAIAEGNDLSTSAGRRAEVLRIAKALKTASNQRILSALGHPGYGEQHATKVLDAWMSNEGQTLHALVYG